MEEEFHETNNIHPSSGNKVDALQNNMHPTNVSTQQQQIVQPNVQRITVPKFNKTNPEFWFFQIESAFRFGNIISDTDKFDLIAMNLEDDLAQEAQYIIAAVAPENRYQRLKSRLIARFAESSESKLQRLLSGLDYSGLKPNEVLARMKSFAPDVGSEPIIRALFMRQMPLSVRPILSIIPEGNIDDLAKTAEKMLNSVDANFVCDMSTQQRKVLNSTNVEAVARAPITGINTSIQMLIDTVQKLQGEVNSLKKAQSVNNNRANPTGNTTTTTNGEPCWYHQKYGASARKCRPGCTYANSTN